MEWSNEQIAQFLELYEGEPSIWNPSDANHKIGNHVHDAWGRISKNLSEAEYSISELKKKNSLMGTYRKLSLKVKARKKTGSGMDGVFNITRRFRLDSPTRKPVSGKNEKSSNSPTNVIL